MLALIKHYSSAIAVVAVILGLVILWGSNRAPLFKPIRSDALEHAQAKYRPHPVYPLTRELTINRDIGGYRVASVTVLPPSSLPKNPIVSPWGGWVKFSASPGVKSPLEILLIDGDGAIAYRASVLGKANGEPEVVNLVFERGTSLNPFAVVIRQPPDR